MCLPKISWSCIGLAYVKAGLGRLYLLGSVAEALQLKKIPQRLNLAFEFNAFVLAGQEGWSDDPFVLSCLWL